ncbi:hypothetical protein [Limnohabitans sp. T6-20]|uniref:hypothetical protein n=1 Tax=Limnohabitans sp. T6-20 TaxID=1100725 RepID=UPI0011B27E31|nr:hypothetical protein [Limnohabitans sp. T6-20]
MTFLSYSSHSTQAMWTAQAFETTENVAVESYDETLFIKVYTMRNRTLADIALAKVYFEILVDFAKSHPGQTIQYGELVAKAKMAYPDSAYVAVAIATNMGRRLDALREFTSQHQVPDLSALVVNKATGDNGEGFRKSFDGEAVRQEIAEFDWAQLQLTFDQFIEGEMHAYQQRVLKARRPKKIKEAAAREMWWTYFKANQAQMPSLTQVEKESIIQMVMQGTDPGDAFAEVTT